LLLQHRIRRTATLPNATAPPQQVQLVGRQLRRLRQDCGLSREELAARLGLQPADVARLEHGDHRLSLALLCRLVAELGAKAESLRAASAPPRADDDDGPAVKVLRRAPHARERR
jgi:transcriptional regulator with XRE-family HTH domain